MAYLISAPLLRLSCLLACALALGSFFPAALSAQQTAPPPQAQQQTVPPPQAQQPAAPAPNPHSAQERAAQRQALGFLQYLDQGRYADSYAYTSSLIRSRMNRAQFAAEIQKDRAPVGAKQSRKLLDASYTTTLEGAPTGQYVVLQYNTTFAKKTGAVETITLSYERGYWRVAGWYLK